MMVSKAVTMSTKWSCYETVTDEEQFRMWIFQGL